ncbi:MAG: mannose-1-phosphate guanylyltransferase/mannose-6-phosphate isomerase [Candidatus Omnitrophica bacterium]|nr:mannose-1-phosphate guanylyltransferase/mannose-6-phosphate isomerase [Candidatus Omnitrophota bacterium]
MKAVILAGGLGTRLWPLSRDNYPKQFIPLVGEDSLLQLCIKRLLSYFKPKDIYIISKSDYLFHIINHIEAIKIIDTKTKKSLRNNIILEPLTRGTAPAIMLFIKLMEKNCGDDEVIFVFPSDHIIEPISKFKKALSQAKQLAEKGYLNILGVKPKVFSPEFGYALVGERLEVGYKVDKFIEKPSLTQIRKFCQEKIFCNMGIFVFTKMVFIEELKKYSPQIFRYYSYDSQQLLRRFSSLPSDSIDYAIMQKTKIASLIEFDGQWLDLGSWDSLLEFLDRCKEKSGKKKDILFKSSNCLTYSKDRFISVLGVSNVIVIDSSDTVLVMRRNYSGMKEFISFLKNNRIPQLRESRTVYRPWGFYTILKEGRKYKVKEIGIYPGKHISLQKHKHRSEHWNIVEGVAKIRLGKDEIIRRANESVYVYKGMKHRIYNPTNNKVLRIIEVQIGDYLGEDDILRFDDYCIA